MRPSRWFQTTAPLRLANCGHGSASPFYRTLFYRTQLSRDRRKRSSRLATLLLIAISAVSAFAAESTASVAEAVMHQDQAAFRSLIEKKADVNAPLVDGTTALHWAVENDDAETVEMLLR